MASCYIQALTLGAIEVYNKVKLNLPPKPTQPSYAFSLHDLSHVFDGIMLLSSRCVKLQATENLTNKANKKELTNQKQEPTNVNQDLMNVMTRTILVLFHHECLRCFGDRLISADGNCTTLKILFNICILVYLYLLHQVSTIKLLGILF